jgi:hypothetical protein
MDEIEIQFYGSMINHFEGLSSNATNWSNRFNQSVVKPPQNFWHGDKNYIGSGWAHGIRQRIASKVHPSNKASNVAEVGMLSQLQFSEVEIVGQALQKIKNDPEIVALDNTYYFKAIKNPQFGNKAFSFRYTKSIEFGGKRAPEDMMSQMKDPFNSKYRATWMVAVSELTWLIRHASVDFIVIVDQKGNIKINHTLNDTFDLRSGKGHTVAYNNVTDILGPMYHDFIGGNDQLKLKATWTIKR